MIHFVHLIVVCIIIFFCGSCGKLPHHDEKFDKIKCVDSKLKMLDIDNTLNIFFIYSHLCELCTQEVLNNCANIIDNNLDEHYIFVFSASDRLLIESKIKIMNVRHLAVFSNSIDILDRCGMLSAESVFVRVENNMIKKWEKL